MACTTPSVDSVLLLFHTAPWRLVAYIVWMYLWGISFRWLAITATVKEVGSHDPSEPEQAFAIFDEKTMYVDELQLTGCDSVTTIHHSFLACQTMSKVGVLGCHLST